MSISIFEHAVPSDGDDAYIMSAPRARVQVTVRHYVLRVLLLRSVRRYLAYLEQSYRYISITYWIE